MSADSTYLWCQLSPSETKPHNVKVIREEELLISITEIFRRAASQSHGAQYDACISILGIGYEWCKMYTQSYGTSRRIDSMSEDIEVLMDVIRSTPVTDMSKANEMMAFVLAVACAGINGYMPTYKISANRW